MTRQVEGQGFAAVDQRVWNWFKSHLPRSFVGSCAVLSLAALLPLPIVAWWANRSDGPQGVLAAAIAALVCWAGATLALGATWWLLRSGNPLAGLLAATFFRTGFPLIAAIVLTNSSRSLSEGGLFRSILLIYFVTLIAEAALSLRLVSSTSESEKAR